MITNNTSLDFEFVHTIIGMHTTIMTFPFIFDFEIIVDSLHP